MAPPRWGRLCAVDPVADGRRCADQGARRRHGDGAWSTGEGHEYVTLTDIARCRTLYGDMDFKVAGTEEFITAVQADFKIHGITIPMIEDIITRARDARLIILDKLQEAIDAPRELSATHPHVPHYDSSAKIGVIIGPVAKMIRIIEETKCTVDVEDDGSVFISSSNENARKAIAMIEGLTREAVIRSGLHRPRDATVDFGAFVEIMPGKEGLVRIGELADYRVPTVEDVVNVGDEIRGHGHRDRQPRPHQPLAPCHPPRAPLRRTSRRPVRFPRR